jgi:superfamily II DNA helicase RecQ
MEDAKYELMFYANNINHFLKDIYREEKRISDVLISSGISEDEISELKRHHLTVYLRELGKKWSDWLRDMLPPRHAEIVVQRYCLDGQPQATLEELAIIYDVSRERIRQLEVNSLKRLRPQKRKRLLESIAVDLARNILCLPKPLNRDEQQEQSILPPAIKVDRNIAEPELQMTAVQEALYDALKDWRYKKSKDEDVPAFVIAHNSTLELIATQEIGDENDLMRVKGFGEKRAAKYGSEILKILADQAIKIEGARE